MAISAARLAANRRNATRSTGPKTAEGKAASRRNALKHGLTGTTVDLDDARAVADRAGAIAAAAPPRWTWLGWVGVELAGITRRLDRLRAEEDKLRDWAAYRALACWDDDRRRAAEDLGARLAADPSRVARQLRATPQGCDWLIERWATLAYLAGAAEGGSGEGWTSEQRRLAFDLMGTSPDARAAAVGLVVDGAGRPTGLVIPDAEVARRALADLRAWRGEVAEVDAVERTLTEDGFPPEPSIALRRLRRYEAALQKRLAWCVEQLDRAGPDPDPRLPPPGARPAPAPAAPRPTRPAPAQPPAARPAAEASLVDRVDPGLPPAATGRPRLDARLHKAESRRDRKRRKLDRRRA